VKLSEGKGVHAKAQRRRKGAKGCPIGVGILDEGYKGYTIEATRNARARGFGIDGWKEPIPRVARGLRVGQGLTGDASPSLRAQRSNPECILRLDCFAALAMTKRGQRSTDVTPAPEPGFGFCDWVVAKAAGPRVKSGVTGLETIKWI
jgi:hypothetical protein